MAEALFPPQALPPRVPVSAVLLLLSVSNPRSVPPFPFCSGYHCDISCSERLTCCCSQATPHPPNLHFLPPSLLCFTLIGQPVVRSCITSLCPLPPWLLLSHSCPPSAQWDGKRWVRRGETAKPQEDDERRRLGCIHGGVRGNGWMQASLVS